MAILFRKPAQTVIFRIVSDVTSILNAIESGDANAAAQLLPLVYEDLRKLAAQKLAHEKAGQTLDATALVHEAYLRLVATDTERPFANRNYFFVAAAITMRRILVENARRKHRRMCWLRRAYERDRVSSAAASERRRNLINQRSNT